MKLHCYNEQELNEFIKSKTNKVDFDDNQYYKEVHNKNQIVLHHTVSDGSSARGDINHWLSNTSRVATAWIITENGIIHQCFDPKYWAHALGCKRAYLKSKDFKDYLHRNKILNREAIQIELDSLGPVDERGHSKAYGHRLKATEFVEYEQPYRGYKFYEKYSDDALETLYQSLRHLTDVYEISTGYKEDMWDVSRNALAGESGIWSHTSFRPDKSDCHPQKELIELLKSI